MYEITGMIVIFVLGMIMFVFGLLELIETVSWKLSIINGVLSFSILCLGAWLDWQVLIEIGTK